MILLRGQRYLLFLLSLYTVAKCTSNVVNLKVDVDNAKAEDYICVSAPISSHKEQYIVAYEPHLNSNIVHHTLLYGCKEKKSIVEHWDCSSRNICENGASSQILYAWALQASGLKLPKSVGFKVGGTKSNAIQTLVIQVHFKSSPVSQEDIPSLDVIISDIRQPFVAGIFLIGRYIENGLPAGIKNYTVDAACVYNGLHSIMPFAFRTHTHTHGVAMYGYIVKSGQWQLIGQRNPQDPQAFYPAANSQLVISPGDIVASRTYYDTENEQSNVMFGAHGMNEMSNFYFMYYTLNDGTDLPENECWTPAPPTLSFPYSDPVLPQYDPGHTHHHISSHTHSDDRMNQNANIESDDTTPQTPPTTTPTIHMDESWRFNYEHFIVDGVNIGQISAVDVDNDDNVYILHRGNIQWNEWSFDNTNVYTVQDDDPISEPVVLKFSPFGTYMNSWGRGIFYIPHGLRVGIDGTLWLTDVAKHQIFKRVESNRVVVLGDKFVPGEDRSHFCKPSDIVLDESNDIFYIADGYCNHRIIAFDFTGKFKYLFPSVVDGIQLQVPHSLALSDDGTELYVADRENMRIIVYNTITLTGSVFYENKQLTGRIFAIEFGKLHHNWPLYAINGSTNEKDTCYGFTIDSNGTVVDIWGPPDGFTTSHDIAVSNNGSHIYVVQLDPHKVLRMEVSTSYQPHPSTYQPHPSQIKSYSSISVTKPYPLSASSIYMSYPSTTEAKPHPSTASVIKPHPSSTTIAKPHHSSTSKPHPSTVSIDAEDNSDDYTCPRPPPPPLINSVPCTTTVISKDNNHMNVTSDKKSFYMILLAIGATFWILFVGLICLAVLCAKRVNFVSSKHNRNLVNRYYSTNPKRKLQSLLNKASSRRGFTAVNTVDSDTDNEMTVFERT